MSLANNKLMNVTQLAVVGWSNGEKLANLILTKVSVSHRKSSQVQARPGQTESQVDPGFQLAATCDSVWPGLYASDFSCSWLLSPASMTKGLYYPLNIPTDY